MRPLASMIRRMWRTATPADDEAIVALCAALNDEDPGADPVPPEYTRRTLDFLRQQPSRGLALVMECEGRIAGYALLIAFWSNELGGETCAVDELYVVPDYRGRGWAERLLRELAEPDHPWAFGAVALTVETTADNREARRLYTRVGFSGSNLALRRRLRN